MTAPQTLDSPKVLLINPRATYAFEIAQKCYPPLNLLYLANALLKAGIEVHVLDANALALSDARIARAVRAYGPDLVGVPLYTEVLASVYRMVCAVHQAVPAARFVMGGPHASALPERVLADFEPVEFVLCGEAEHSLVQLCGALRGAVPLAQVRGLVYRSRGRVRANGSAPPERDIESLGFPARHLLADLYEKKKYYTLLVRERPVDTIMTSRGCPFRCHFCYNVNHRYRSRSTAHVMEEIHAIYRRGVRDIEIVDDTFTFRRDRAMSVFDALIKDRLPISFRIKSRVDVVDEEFLRRAKRAGAYLIAYGTESGDDDMLRRMNKRTTAADNERAIRLTKEAGIAAHTSWIIGYPGETPESIARTVEFIVRTRPTTAQIALLRPYPQTIVYAEARDAGTLKGEWSIHSDDYPWVQLPWTRTREDLERCVQRAMRRVYYRPYYVFQFARMVLGSANVTLARYAWQEARKTLGYLLRFGTSRGARPGSV